MSICIGITSFNCLHYLRNNISSIMRYSGSNNIRIVVIDNASTDGTRGWLLDQTSDGCVSSKANVQVNTILNSFNGYASYGCHQAIDYFITQTDCEYFFHLDPDCEFRRPAVFENIVKQFTADSTLGAIGEKRYSLRYQHPKSRSLKIFDQYIMEGSWRSKYGDEKLKGKTEDLVIEQHPNQLFNIYNELCGNVMIFRRNVVEKIGSVDIARFKMWRWDSEYSMRCLLHGYNIAEANIVKSREVFHFGGRSRAHASDRDKYLLQLGKDLGLSANEILDIEKRYSKEVVS